MILALIVGLLFGFFGSMPIAGPTAIVILSKGLDDKVRAGLLIATGAAVAESMYAFMAFWGLTATLSRFPVLLPASRVIGAVLLVGLGLYFVVRRSKEPGQGGDRDATPRAGYRNVAFGFSLTAVNPTLLVTWTAAVSAAHSFGALRVNALDAFPFAGGAGVGIVGWFSIFLWLLAHFRSRLRTATLDRVIRAMGILLIALGLVLAVRAARHWPSATAALDPQRVVRRSPQIEAGARYG